MITSERMAAVDRNAAALGVPRKQLMESSGNAVARAVREVADPGDAVAVVAGRGNNGGDAFAAVRFLDDYDVTVLLLGRADAIGTAISRENWAALQAMAADTREVRDSSDLVLPDADVLVDAVFGTGISGVPREPAATAIEAVNDHPARVVSVDVPSGLDADTGATPGPVVDADRVVTFHDEKPGLADLAAALTVADIGIPSAAELFVGPGDLRGLERDPSGHKGDHGDLLVIGGGPYAGAPALSAQAAYRAGADLVHLAVPETVADAVQSYDENHLLHPLEGDHLGPAHVGDLRSLAADRDVVVVGPGLGDADATREAVRQLLADLEGTVVVDADALAVVPDVDADADLVCTPHRGELRTMGGPAVEDGLDDREAVAAFAAELGAVLLVKGPDDVVSDGERTRVNRTGTPAMTVGGTGDVLAGTTAALAARLEPLQAAAVGAYATGLAGEAAAPGANGLLPTDLLGELPAALEDEGP